MQEESKAIQLMKSAAIHAIVQGVTKSIANVALLILLFDMGNLGKVVSIAMVISALAGVLKDYVIAKANTELEKELGSLDEE
jgi:hypothetical protein